MINSYRFIMLFLVFVTLFSCKEDAKKETEKENENKKDVTIAIDSSAFKIDKEDFEVKSVVDDVKPSSQTEVQKMVKEQAENLTDHQKFVQEFFAACAEKNYSKAASFLAYKGADKSRNNAAPYNVADKNELNIVKTTVDVVFQFLANSQNFKFSKVKETETKVGMVKSIEVNFFKKGLGIDRHFFEVMDTEKGMLIYNMK